MGWKTGYREKILGISLINIQGVLLELFHHIEIFLCLITDSAPPRDRWTNLFLQIATGEGQENHGHAKYPCYRNHDHPTPTVHVRPRAG